MGPGLLGTSSSFVPELNSLLEGLQHTLCDLCCARCVGDGQAWLAYSTGEQVVGLIAWPLDGDPKHSMGVIAHPGEVSGMALSFDGRKLVTLGECCVVYSCSSFISEKPAPGVISATAC